MKGLGGWPPSGQAFGFLDTFNPPEPWHWVYVNPGPWVGPCDDGGAVEDPTACTPAPVAGAEGEVFQDLPPGAFGKAEAEALLSAGITNGCAPDLFCPDCLATRGQSVTLLLRAAGIDVGGPLASSSFEDVPPDAYYAPYVEKALELGITQGCSPTTFCPDDPTTRKQFAKLLVETLGVPTVSPGTPTFTDVAPGDWGYPYVETLKALCITTGCSPTTFCPGDPVTRAMAAVFIARGFDLQDTNDCIQYCDGPTCADASFCEGWGSCDYADVCDEEATRTRTCHDLACEGPITDAACVDTPGTESEACTRDTDGVEVEGWGAWSACVPDAPCADVGSRSRQRTVCAGGVAAAETQTEACAPPEDPKCREPADEPDGVVDVAEPVAEVPEDVGPEVPETPPPSDLQPSKDVAPRAEDPGPELPAPSSDEGAPDTWEPDAEAPTVPVEADPETGGGCEAASGAAGGPPCLLLLALLGLRLRPARGLA